VERRIAKATFRADPASAGVEGVTNGAAGPEGTGSRPALSIDELRGLDEAEAAQTPTYPAWWQRPDEDTLTEWYWSDPEPGFQGMISSDRILAYHYKVGRMIRPFQETNLKPASYELTLGPLYVMNGKRGILSDTKRRLTIEPNSIAFVSMREQILLPHWLVGRFDLSINFIYQGLLLGTGPQVDPGFQGVLSCPLHNISSDEIELVFGEPFAKIDFVKTSFGYGIALPNVQSDEELREKSPLTGYEGQPLKVLGHSKTFRAPILFAPDKEPERVRSSVRDLAVRVAKSEKIVRRNRNFSVAGAVAVVALLATMFAGAVGAFVYTLSYTDGRVADKSVTAQQFSTLKDVVDSLTKQNQTICDELRRLSPSRTRPTRC
jgi:deoxycytidine triphosphate deaminase